MPYLTKKFKSNYSKQAQPSSKVLSPPVEEMKIKHARSVQVLVNGLRGVLPNPKTHTPVLA